jgi:homoserine kinase
MKCRVIEVFAPATVANLGPGFDAIGLAIEGLGDRLIATTTESGIRIIEITGDQGELPTKWSDNTATVAANCILKTLANPPGIDVVVHKGLSLGSGLGSSAASAAAGAWAAAVLGGIDPRVNGDTLLRAGRLGEEIAAGVGHADNVAPSLFGGVSLIRHRFSDDNDERLPPVEVIALPAPSELRVVVATPHFSVPTKAARRVLPAKVPLASVVHNSANLAAMVAGFFTGDLELIGRAVSDVIVEPARGSIIAGFARVKAAALDAGALGCSIAGAGPTCFAFVANSDAGQRVGEAMSRAWRSAHVECIVHVGAIDVEGARVVSDSASDGEA